MNAQSLPRCAMHFKQAQRAQTGAHPNYCPLQDDAHVLQYRVIGSGNFVLN